MLRLHSCHHDWLDCMANLQKAPYAHYHIQHGWCAGSGSWMTRPRARHWPQARHKGVLLPEHCSAMSCQLWFSLLSCCKKFWPCHALQMTLLVGSPPYCPIALFELFTDCITGQMADLSSSPASRQSTSGPMQVQAALCTCSKPFFQVAVSDQPVHDLGRCAGAGARCCDAI